MISISMGASFLTTIILANKLSIELFGQYNFFKSIFPMLSVFVLLGLDKSYIKYFSKNKLKKDYKLITYLIFFNSIVITLLFSYLYSLSDYLIPIFFCILFASINLFLSSQAALEKKYMIAQFMQNGYKIIFLICIISFINVSYVKLINVINLYLVSFSIPLIYFAFYLKDQFNREKFLKFPEFYTLFKNGILFFLINFINLLIVNMEKLTIPYIYDDKSLGVYVALSFIYMTIFNMMGTAIGFVLFPELTNNPKNINIKKMITFSLLLMFSLGLFFFLFGTDLNSFIYKGKFDIFSTFKSNLMMILIASIQFINAPLHWIILAIGKGEDVKLYLKAIFSILIFYFITVVLVLYKSISFFDIIPIILIAWLLKLFLTGLIINKIFTNHKKSYYV